MIPFLRVLVAILFGGLAVWFLHYRYDRKEPSVWFFVWLVASALTYTLSAAAYWVADMTISQSLLAASFVILSLSLFFIFTFARSFIVDASHVIFYWAIPLMFNISLIIMEPEALFARSGDLWAIKEFNAAAVIYVAIDMFYGLLALYYVFALYGTLRSHDQVRELRNWSYILAGLLIVFASAAAGGWLKASVDPGIPVVEIGNLLGALLIMRGVTGPIFDLGGARRAEGER